MIARNGLRPVAGVVYFESGDGISAYAMFGPFPSGAFVRRLLADLAEGTLTGVQVNYEAELRTFRAPFDFTEVQWRQGERVNALASSPADFVSMGLSEANGIIQFWLNGPTAAGLRSPRQLEWPVNVRFDGETRWLGVRILNITSGGVCNGSIFCDAMMPEVVRALESEGVLP